MMERDKSELTNNDDNQTDKDKAKVKNNRKNNDNWTDIEGAIEDWNPCALLHCHGQRHQAKMFL